MHLSFKLKNINPVIFFMPASNKESRRQIHSEMFRQTDRQTKPCAYETKRHGGRDYSENWVFSHR